MRSAALDSPVAVEPPDADLAAAVERLLVVAAYARGVATPILGELRRMPTVPVPGLGRTPTLFELLTELGSLDLTAARVIEPHLDAVAILAQAGVAREPGSAWGVFASASPVAIDWSRPDSNGARRRARLTGRKRWCSLAAQLDRALVTARDEEGEWLFELDLRQHGVTVEAGGTPLTGLRGVPSGAIDLEEVPVRLVGPTVDWYTRRPGFAWGAIGVAAVWCGGAVALAQALLGAALRSGPDQLGLAWLGEADRLLHGARVQLADAARRVDDASADWALAQQLRGNVAEVCARIIWLCGESLGPAPLAFDEAHARRVADLSMYLRQHHGARDDAARGAELIAGRLDGAANRGQHGPGARR